jgi:hypothetical protein
MSESCDDSEVYPDGYEEALADCTVFAAQLLKMALQNKQKANLEVIELDRL